MFLIDSETGPFGANPERIRPPKGLRSPDDNACRGDLSYKGRDGKNAARLRRGVVA
jgi:hypothetical protein